MKKARFPALLTGGVILFCVLSLCSVLYRADIAGRGALLYDFDAQYWYVGGACWLAGQSPYDAAAFARMWTRTLGDHTKPSYDTAFVYPPTLLLLGVPMALLPWDSARLLLRIGLYGCFIAGCLLAMRMVLGRVAGGWRNHALWLLAGCCGLLVSVSQAVLQGQTSLIVMCGILLLVLGWQRQRSSLFILGLLVAAIKPQISLLVLLFALFGGAHRQVLVGVAVTALVSALLLLGAPDTALAAHVRESIQIHMQQQVFNQYQHYDGLPGLLAAHLGGRPAFLGGIALGMAAAVALGRLQRRHSMPDPFLLQLVYALSVALMPLHRYDTVLYVPLLISLVVLPLRLRLLPALAIVLQGVVWKSGFLRLYAEHLLDLPADRIQPFVRTHYWDVASNSAALFAGLILLLVLYAYLRAPQYARSPS